jgi:pimeloyl-ACP methyl ester carboxylesterase
MICEIINQAEDLSLPKGNRLSTLVIDAGMGNWSLFFYPLAEELKKLARVCLLSRDGYLDAVDEYQDEVSVALQMNSTLHAHGIDGPLVLVGHSLGGLHVRIYQQLFPEQVEAMILLDAAPPRLFDVFPGIKKNIEKQMRMVSVLIALGRLGLLRWAKNKIPTFGLPRPLLPQYYRITTTARYYMTYQWEMRNFQSTLSYVKSLRDLGDLPLLVIGSPYGLNQPITESATNEKVVDDDWQQLQLDLSKLSSRSTFIQSKGDHFLQLTDTPGVAKAIQKFYAGLYS